MHRSPFSSAGPSNRRLRHAHGKAPIRDSATDLVDDQIMASSFEVNISETPTSPEIAFQTSPEIAFQTPPAAFPDTTFQTSPEIAFQTPTAAFPFGIVSESRRILWVDTLVTTRWTWLGGAICFLFSLGLIACGVTVLVVYFGIKPRLASTFSSASISRISFEPLDLIRSDVSLVATFTNPSRTREAKFQEVAFAFLFNKNLIASQGLVSFSDRHGETKLQPVQFITDLVMLPIPDLAELRRE
ncbi:hypothetical protein AALP_AA5G242200, partial [Arabis alpina]